MTKLSLDCHIYIYGLNRSPNRSPSHHSLRRISFSTVLSTRRTSQCHHILDESLLWESYQDHLDKTRQGARRRPLRGTAMV